MKTRGKALLPWSRTSKLILAELAEKETASSTFSYYIWPVVVSSSCEFGLAAAEAGLLDILLTQLITQMTTELGQAGYSSLYTLAEASEKE